MRAFLKRHGVRLAFYGAVLAALLLGVRFRHELLRAAGVRGWERYRSVGEVVARHRPAVTARFRPVCERAGVGWPPERLVLLLFKQERSLEVWAEGPGDLRARLATYPCLGLSGGLGPKRRSGDLQVPEGFYGLPKLNPNSAHHLSILVGYPNDEDLAHAEVPPDRLGGEIYVHGGSASLGCAAIGDPAIEEVFTLAALVDESDRRIVISPVDFRRADAPAPAAADARVADLYRRLREALDAWREPSP